MEAFSQGYKSVLPTYIAILFPTILIAAMMSTLDSATFVFSAELSKIKLFVKKRVFWTKLFIILTLVVGGLFSLTIFDALSFAYTINGFVALLTIPILISFWKDIPTKLLIVSFSIGLIFYIIQIILGRIIINSSEAIYAALITGLIIYIGLLVNKNKK
jgi:hypothetical protein